MSKSLAVAAVLSLAAARPARAAEVPKAELFGGYSFSQADRPDGKQGLNGWVFALDVGLRGRFAVALELARHYGSEGQSVDLTDLTFMGGARFLLVRGRSIRVFAQGLAGGAQPRATIKPVAGISISEDTGTHFAWAAGGGVDLGLGEHWGIRAQGDYLSLSRDGGSEGNPRLAAGILYQFH